MLDPLQADRGAGETFRLRMGDTFDPADLSEAEAARVLAAVDAFPGLSDSAKETYVAIFMLARRRGRGGANGSM
jgi:hypothetical protein